MEQARTTENALRKSYSAKTFFVTPNSRFYIKSMKSMLNLVKLHFTGVSLYWPNGRVAAKKVYWRVRI